MEHGFRWLWWFHVSLFRSPMLQFFEIVSAALILFPITLSISWIFLFLSTVTSRDLAYLANNDISDLSMEIVMCIAWLVFHQTNFNTNLFLKMYLILGSSFKFTLSPISHFDIFSIWHIFTILIAIIFVLPTRLKSYLTYAIWINRISWEKNWNEIKKKLYHLVLRIKFSKIDWIWISCLDVVKLTK